MSTLYGEVERIENAKSDIADAIRAKDVDVTEDASIESYNLSIDQINGQPRIIKFYVSGAYNHQVICNAEEGMTFGNWYFSSYLETIQGAYTIDLSPNGSEFEIEDISTMNRLCDSEGNRVTLNTSIIEGATYIWQN